MPRLKEFDQKEALRKAMNLFWNRGYHATSMQDLVDTLGISRGSLYDTFGGKRELFDRALQQYRDFYFAQMEALLRSCPSAIDGLRQLFEGTLENAMRDPEHKGCFMVNATTELAASDDTIRTAMVENKRAVESLFLKTLKKGQETGEIDQDKNLRQTASLLFAFYNGFQVLARLQPERRELHSLVKGAMSILQ
ncbi:MAG: TetR/AcrR family transcriptional regulator [Leptospiraceae bacterium]|nr:TetR/AcrR family transcriptional regulator [Leptospiraceae bacterium]